MNYMIETHEPTDLRETTNPAWLAINWNNAEKTDNLSYSVWKKLTENFWLPEKIAVSNDTHAWNTLPDEDRLLTMRVFAGLTTLDTIQSRFGAPALMLDSNTLFEEAVYANIAFMEAVHAKSYSNIFSTLASTKEINSAFHWANTNILLRKKSDTIMSYYKNTEHLSHPHLRRKVASTFLESFLFYSGFYLPLYYSSQGILTNTANLIRLIIRDEALHGYYIGAKFQEEFTKLEEKDQTEITEWAYDLLAELYENEALYTQELYDTINVTEDVKVFLRYNANKALQNLGFSALFPFEEVNSVILNQLSIAGKETHDFFSAAGTSYTMATVEELQEEDWDDF